MSRPRLIAALTCALAFTAPAAALAAPACTRNPPAVTTLAGGQGTLESIIFDRRGRLLFTSGMTGGTGELNRMRRPGATPKPIVTGVEAPGGLALLPGRELLLGYGDSIANGSTGDANPQAGLLRVDLRTRETSLYADGLGMANGVSRARDGTVFASNDFGSLLDRIAPDGTVDHGWATVQSTNGLVVDPAQRYLYAAQTFQPAAVQRIELANPANVTPFFTAEAPDAAAGFDGMARDRRGNLFIAANGAGQAWRISRGAKACVLASGLGQVSAVAKGRPGNGFRRDSLYAVNFGGDVIELAGALRSRP